MLKTPGKRHVLISLNKNRFPFMPHFLLYYFFFYIQVPSLLWPFLHQYKHFSFTLPCPSSPFYWFDPPEGQFHVDLIPLLSSSNTTPGILSMLTYSSAFMGYYLGYITPTSHNLVDKGAWEWSRIYVIWDCQPQYINTQTQHTTRTLKVVWVSWKV